MVKRGCNICRAYFSGSLSETLQRIGIHKEECTKDKPFYDDESADGYEEEVL